MTDADWQAKVTDDHLFRVISEGGPAAKLHQDMPAWGLRLSRKQIEGLVEHIRSLDDSAGTAVEVQAIENAQRS